MRFWGKLKTDDRILKDTVVNSADFPSALKDICDFFDLSKPLVLEKHKSEMETFRRTLFLPDDFVERVPFSALEIERLVEKKKGKM